MSEIVVVGSLNMDTVVSVPYIPKIGETILATDVNYYGGGKGANQAIAVARLGSSVSMIGKVGKDKNGRALLDSLTKEGVDTTSIEVSENITGTAFINVSSKGENNIVVYPGANKDLDIAQIERHRKVIENSSVCVLQLEIPYEVVKHVINICYEKDVKVIFNPAPATSGIEDELIRKTYILIPNETELNILSGTHNDSSETLEDVAKKVYNKGCENLIVTLGEKGGLYLQNKEIEYFKSKKVVPIDTTAAGDSFVGAMAASIVEGKTIPESIEFATFAAALTVTKPGAQYSLPTKREVEEFIKLKQ